jgi:hypothetical protein
VSLDENKPKSVYFSVIIFKASKKIEIENQKKGFDDRFEIHQG